MPKRNDKYPTGQIVRILESRDISERFHGKYAYITSYVEHTYATIGESEYGIIVQGYPGLKYRVSQEEIQVVE